MSTTLGSTTFILRALALFLIFSSVTAAEVPHRLPRKDWISRNVVKNEKRQIALRSPDVPLPNVRRMPNDSKKCTKPRMRKEWRRLTDAEKRNYLDSIHCMKMNPPKFSDRYPNIKNRYDDFVAYHINATGNTPGTHNNGYFLPFHRYLIWNWENVLKEECGMTLSGIPYWDWSLDTPERNGSFTTSPVFDNVLGFGGDGRWVPAGSGQPRCLDTGPFSGYPVRLTYRNMVDAQDRCVERDFNIPLAEKSSSWSKVLKPSLEQDNYEDFSELDFAPGPFTRERGGPHTIGHMGVSGEMANLFSSTNDPLFFLHHGGIDHFWYQWQERNKTRFRDVRRSIIDFHRLNEPVPADRIEGITTLNTPVFQTGEFAPLIEVAQIMDTINEDGSGILCYVYDSEYVDFRGTPVAAAMPNGGKPNPNAYPSVPAQKLEPWTGLPPDDGGGRGFDQAPNEASAPHHHHGPEVGQQVNVTAIPEQNQSGASSVAMPQTVDTPVSTVAMPQAVETPVPSVVFPVEMAMETDKPKTSGAQGEPFLGLGAQPGSGSQRGSSSFLHDPPLGLSDHEYMPLPKISSQEQTLPPSAIRVQAPLGGYAPARLANSGLLPLS